MFTLKNRGLLTLVLLMLAQLVVVGAQNYPQAKVGAKATARGTVEEFLERAQSGDVAGALELCDFEVGNGKSMVPAEGQVKKLVGFLRARTIKKEKERQTTETLFQVKYSVKEDSDALVINVTKLKDHEWLVTAINLKG